MGCCRQVKLETSCTGKRAGANCIYRMTRAKLNPWPDQLLESSILRVGALAPRIVFEGKILDGKRRSAICERLVLPIEEVVCETRREAASALYAFEPARAVQLFGQGGAVSFSLLLGCRVGYVARWFRRPSSGTSTQQRKVERLRRYVAKCEQGLVTPDPEYLRKVLW